MRLKERKKKNNEVVQRIFVYQKLVEYNHLLFSLAKNHKVTNLTLFHDYGLKGLYLEEVSEIRKRKRLKRYQNIYDYMESEELVDNLFRIVHTTAVLRKSKGYGTKDASIIHYQVGLKVRKTIRDLGGTSPELLPTPYQSITEIKKEHF